VALLDFMFDDGRADMDACFSPDVPPLERFQRLTDMWLVEQREALEKYGRVCGCPFTSIGSEMAVQDDQICAKVQEMIGRVERYFESALRDAAAEGLLPPDTDIRAKASEIYAYGVGAEMKARIQNSLTPLEDMKKSLPGLITATAYEKID
jgi:TetR/AcrR family transcriptional repressor of nem operon